MLGTSCRRDDASSGKAAPEAPAAAAAERPAILSETLKRPRLREDPRLAREASAQWNEHLAEEEEHRRLCYDRDRLAEHRALVTELESLRAGLSRARTAAEVERARARVTAAAPALERRLAQIDPHDNSSNLVEHHRATLTLLGGDYAEALAAAKAGQGEALAQLEPVLNRRSEQVQSLLERSARCKDE